MFPVFFDDCRPLSKSGMPIALCIVVLTAIGASPAPTRSEITDYAVARQISYIQTSDAQPTTADYWNLLAVLVYDVPNEVINSTLEFEVPPPVSHNLDQTIATQHLFFSTIFESESEFMADFPETTYTITADRGAGLESGSVFLPADRYCPEIPYFTGDTFTRMQNYDASQDFDATINGFTLAAGTDAGLCYVVVVEENVGTVYVNQLEPHETEFQIPADTLAPERNYSISISYLDYIRMENAGFNGAASEAEYFRSTTSYFTTIAPPTPCCRGDFNDDNLVDALDIQGFIDALMENQACP